MKGTSWEGGYRVPCIVRWKGRIPAGQTVDALGVMMDLYRELKEQLPGTEQRMVFMTGGAFTPRAAEFLTTVSNPRLEKPFDLTVLRGIIGDLQRAA